MTTTHRTRNTRRCIARRTHVARILLMLGGFAATSGALADDGRAVVVPDAILQSAIAQILDAQSADEQRDRLNGLADSDRSRDAELIRQLAFVASRATNTRDAMTVGVIMRRLDAPDRVVVRALAPYVDSVDRDLRKSVRSMLGGLEHRAAGRRPDFSNYREFIAMRLRNNESLPHGLIHYMFDADAGVALLTLMRAHQLREPAEIKVLLWAEHAVSDVLWKHRFGFLDQKEVEPAAARELTKLSSHDAWWARLYVAEIMRQHPAFAQPALIAALSNDTHALVRAAATNAP